MSYFDGISQPEVFLKERIDFLSTAFVPYKKFLAIMDALVYPDPKTAGTAQARWNPAIQFSDREIEKQGQSQFLSNTIEQMINNWIGRMERAPTFIDVARIAETQSEGRNQHVIEEHLLGVYARLNRRAARVDINLSHMSELAKWVGRYHKVIQFPRVVKRRDRWDYIWDFYHPANVYHDFGSSCRQVVYEFITSRQHAGNILWDATGKGIVAGKISEKKPTDPVIYSEIWVEDEYRGDLKVTRATYLDGEFQSIDDDTGYDEMPIQIISYMGAGAKFQTVTTANTSPQSGTQNGIITFQGLEDHARPFYASLVNTKRILDDVMSMELQGMSLTVSPPLHIETPGGQSINGEIGPGTRIYSDTENQVRVKVLELIGKSANQYMAPDFLREQMEHVWPRALWSSTAGANESGILFAQRIDQAKTAIATMVRNVAVALEMGCESILHQEKRHHVKTALPAPRIAGNNIGDFEAIAFDADADVSDDIALRVTVPEMLPEDELKVQQVMQIALLNGYDQRYVLQEIGKVRDPQGMLTRKLQDQLRNGPEALAMAKSWQMHDEAESWRREAERQTTPANRAYMLRRANWIKAQADQFDVKMAGVGQPFQMQPQPSTPAPAQQPPEARGAENPSLQRALAGVAPPGGRPSLQPQKGA